MRIITFLITFILLTSSAWSSQRDQVKEANERFKSGQYDAAIDGYLNALESKDNAALVQYNLGTAFYKTGNYDQAIEHLKKTVTGKDSNLSSKAHYNLGNALYKKAQSIEDSNPDEAIKLMNEAQENYQTASILSPKDKDIKSNIQVVKKKKEELKKKKKNRPSNGKGLGGPKDGKEDPKSKDTMEDSQKDSSTLEKNKDAKDKSLADKGGDKKDQISEQKAEKENAKGQEGETKEYLEKKNAKQMLMEYEREDAPKGILYFMDRHQGDERHVDKDW